MPALQLQLKPSKLFFIIMFVIVGGAFVSIFCSYLPYYIQFLLAALVLIYGGHLITGTVLLKKQSAIMVLTAQADQYWVLKERSGKEYPAFLCGDSTRFPGVSILRFKLARPQEGVIGFFKKRCNVLVFYDSINSICYRRLQMKLGIT